MSFENFVKKSGGEEPFWLYEEPSHSSFAVDKEEPSLVHKTSAEVIEWTEGTCAVVNANPSPSSFALCQMCNGSLQPIRLWEPVKNLNYSIRVKTQAILLFGTSGTQGKATTKSTTLVLVIA